MPRTDERIAELEREVDRLETILYNAGICRKCGKQGEERRSRKYSRHYTWCPLVRDLIAEEADRA